MKAHPDLEQDLAALCRELRDTCEYLEIRVEESVSADLSFQGRDLESLNRRSELGGNVRALVRGAWGFTTFNSLEDVGERARAAVAQARLAGGGPVVLAPVAPVVDRVPLVAVRDPTEIGLDEKVERMRRLDAIVLGFGSPITTSSAYYGDRRARIWMATSEGTALYQERMDASGGVVAIANREGSVQRRGYSSGSSADPSLPDLTDEEVERICRECADLTRAPKPRAGDYTVVISPRLAGVFAHEAIGHLSESDHVSENPKLREVMEIGRRLGNPDLDVYDTGLVAGSRGALRYDEEGVPAARTDLISKGVLVGRLHSRETAGMMGESATGSARAINYRHPPIVRMRSTFIGPGRHALAEMFNGIDNGLYCVDSLGGQTNGEMFTFSAGYARRIENGEPGDLLRDVSLAGNTFKTMLDIEMIEDRLGTSNEAGGGCGKAGQAPLPVGFGAPHLRIREVRIGGD